MELSVVEQSPRLRRLYTQICFCYEMDSDQKIDELTQTLTNGLQQLTNHIPWLAGQIISEGASEGNTGTFKVVDYEKIPRLVVKRYTKSNLMPTYPELNGAGFPFTMLNERELCPRTTLSEDPGESESDPAPVALLQANQIKGGLLLTITVSHITMDIVGQVQMIRLLSKACRNEPLSTKEINGGNLDRRKIIPLVPHSDRDTFESDSRARGAPVSNDSTESTGLKRPHPDLRWSCFKLAASSLLALKASLTTAPSLSSSFISTDDAVCALLWSAIGRARISRLPPSTTTTFIRQVDVRHLLAIPEDYLGNMVTQAVIALPLHVLLNESLGNIATKMRSALDPDNLEHQMRAFASSQACTKNKASGSPRDRSQMIVMSSWAKTCCYDLDFGLGLGKPAAVCRPAFTPTEGLIYLLPKAPNGDLVAGICLSGDDMNKVEHDFKLLQYSKLVS